MVALMQNWVVRKPVAASRGGVVASQNGVAATAGAEILAAGGTAVDAVVATAFALSVREPWNSGLGGIGFMVVHPPGATRAEVVDFGPIAPRGLDPAAYKLTGDTLARLAEYGPDDFYAGDIARAIVADIRAGGGFLSAEDLAGCRARTVPSLDVPYRGVTFQAARGLTAAPTLADVLDRLAGKS